MGKMKKRTSRTSLGREGSPKGGNGPTDPIQKMIRQLEAHAKGKKTKLFDQTSGKMKVADKAGNDKTHTDYLMSMAKADKRKTKNAKGNS